MRDRDLVAERFVLPVRAPRKRANVTHRPIIVSVGASTIDRNMRACGVSPGASSMAASASIG